MAKGVQSLNANTPNDPTGNSRTDPLAGFPLTSGDVSVCVSHD